jgi:hypothetical protein
MLLLAPPGLVVLRESQLPNSCVKKLHLVSALAAVALATYFTVSAHADMIYWSDDSSAYGSIHALDVAGGKTSTLITGTGPGANNIVSPYALAMGPDGNLYVANNTNDIIVKVTPKGAATNFVTGLSNDVYGICFDPLGNLYITLPQNGSIFKVSPSGTYSYLVHQVKNYYQLRSDPVGNVYAGTVNGSIDKITSAGVATNFSGPQSPPIFWAPNGDLYQSTVNSITKTTPTGVTTTVASGFVYAVPIGIGSAGDFYVYDTMGVLSSGGGTIYDVSPTGVASAIGNAPYLTDAVVAPEPNTIAIAALSGVFALLRLRHRSKSTPAPEEGGGAEANLKAHPYPVNARL